MPFWLIIILLLLALSLSSGHQSSRTAQSNALEGAAHSERAQSEHQQRLDECGSRCDDVRKDFATRITKE